MENVTKINVLDTVSHQIRDFNLEKFLSVLIVGSNMSNTSCNFAPFQVFHPDTMYLQELPIGLKQPAEAARLPQNRTKNRYGNIIACE